MITISLCMIVKNEEKILDRCLSCVADLMDEIIIVDTGSQDRTKEIAGRYTGKVYDFQWTGDFSAARNYAFSHATKEYIYSADADEVIDAVNRERFRILKELLLPEIEIVQMYYTNQLGSGTVYNYDKEYRPKLFKRVRGFTWIDPVHETIRTAPVVYDSEIEIIHKQEESHAGRDLAIFHRMYAKGERLSARLHNLYARELFIAGEKEDFLKAEAFFSASCGEEDKPPDEIKEAVCVAARAARLRGDKLKFCKFALKAVAAEGCSEICLELGRFYEEEGDYEEAALWYYNAAFETESILDIRCKMELPLLGLAECCRMLGLKEEAAGYEASAKEWKHKNGR